ncbi:hypothetical protein F5051DRAFT_444801 [Lentinula edodes]|nr:hypothetical protein F5051DRAFT_444801 [Lentinula edodes]
MVTLLQTLASRLSFFVLLLIVLGAIATPLPMFEALNDTAGLLERRAIPVAVKLYLKRGHYQPDGTFLGFRVSTVPATPTLHRDDEFLMLFSRETEEGWGLRAIQRHQDEGDELLTWRLEPVRRTQHSTSDLFLGTLNFPSKKAKWTVLGNSGPRKGKIGGMYRGIYPGSNALQVYNQIIQLRLTENPTYFVYKPDPRNPFAWEDFYTAVMEPAEYKGTSWNVKELL